jgi:hypothetical protein
MKSMLNPPVKVGDRIICYHMENETSVPPGTMGTVTRVQKDPFEPNPEDVLISVNWDNGSTLSLVSATDAWKKFEEERIEEQSGDERFDFATKNPEIFENFDWKFFREYMNQVRKTGVVNVFNAAPLLYSGKEHINRYYGEKPSKTEEFEKLLDMADNARDKMAQGVINYLESKGQEVELGRVNRLLPRMAQSLVELWMKFY